MWLPRRYRVGAVVGGTGTADVVAGVGVDGGAWVNVWEVSGPGPSGSITVVVGPCVGSPGPGVVVVPSGEVGDSVGLVVGVVVVVVVVDVVVVRRVGSCTWVRGTQV